MAVLVLLAVLSVCVVIAIAWKMHCAWRLEHGHRNGNCTRCGYDLRAVHPHVTSGELVCPECGASPTKVQSSMNGQSHVLGTLDRTLAWGAGALFVVAIVALVVLGVLSKTGTGLW